MLLNENKQSVDGFSFSESTTAPVENRCKRAEEKYLSPPLPQAA
jgi:hypothetical protein